MKPNTILAVLFCLLYSALLLFLIAIPMLLVYFSGSDRWLYIPVLLAVWLGISVGIFLFKFKTVPRRWLLLGSLSLMFVAGVVVGSNEIWLAYVHGLPEVSEQGVNLRGYLPFAEGTKAVALDGESTLRFSADLPILDGATALYPLYAAFVQAVYPKDKYPIKAYEGVVRCGTTIDAYNGVINGTVDMIFAARPSEKQLEQARAKGITLNLTPIGREAFVFFVNSTNPVRALTSAQLRDIYSGKIRNWNEVGGRWSEIKAFQRPQDSGSQTMLQKFMESAALIKPPQKEDVITFMGGIIDRTADYRNFDNAIGYSFLYFATVMVTNNQIALLAVDGVMPTRQTIAAKTYPLTADFYVVTAGTRNPNVQPFIEWILSPQGQSLVEKTGYTRVR